MKKIILGLLLLCSFVTTKSQNCIKVQWSYFDNPSGDNIHWRLLVNYQSDGTKHLNIIAKNNNVNVLDTCFETVGGGQTSGTKIYNLVVPNATLQSLSATFYRYTGRCGGGTMCDSPQNLIDNVLPIKVSSLYAKNIGNTTEVTFKVESIDDRKITFNFTMKNGSIKKYYITLPDYAKDGDTWKVIINNINGTYITQKL
jgi:hypothetical protein